MKVRFFSKTGLHTTDCVQHIRVSSVLPYQKIGPLKANLNRKGCQKNRRHLEELCELSFRKWYLRPVKMAKYFYVSLPKHIEVIIQNIGSSLKYPQYTVTS